MLAGLGVAWKTANWEQPTFNEDEQRFLDAVKGNLGESMLKSSIGSSISVTAPAKTQKAPGGGRPRVQGRHLAELTQATLDARLGVSGALPRVQREIARARAAGQAGNSEVRAAGRVVLDAAWKARRAHGKALADAGRSGDAVHLETALDASEPVSFIFSWSAW